MNQVQQSKDDYLSLGQGKNTFCFLWEEMCCPVNEDTGQDACTTIEEVQMAIDGSRAACYFPEWITGVPEGEQWAYCRPHAADYFEHFLNNSGKDMNLDMDTFLSDVPEFQEEIDDHQQELIDQALKDAKGRGIDGPITYPVSTEKKAWGYPPNDPNGKDFIYENPDWKNAIGSFHYWLEGEITVYPPKEPGEKPTYSLDAEVNMEKWYDWERDTHTPVFDPSEMKGKLIGFSQSDLAALHQYGMAQEFWIRGNKNLPTVKG
ncbi:hypothetical protein [Nocardiopsis rhodophaea]